MRIKQGNVTVGDAKVPVTMHSDTDLTGKVVYFEFVKPNGEVIRRRATIVGYNALYESVSDDFDIDGVWYVYCYNATDGQYFNNESGNAFEVRPKPSTQARG